MEKTLRWRRVALPVLLGVLTVVLTLFFCWRYAAAGYFTGGAGGCGAFDDAVGLAQDGDVVVQMIPARDSNGAVLTKNLRLSGGWEPTANCDEANQYFTTTADYLAAGFKYQAPLSRTGLFHAGDSILTIEDTAAPGYPRVEHLIIEHFELSNGGIAANGGGIGGVISDGAELLLDNVWFLQNSVFLDGGGLHLTVDKGSHLRIEDSLFRQNEADDEGGALFVTVRGGSRLTLVGTEFTENQALFGGGVEIRVYDESEVVIRDAVFDNNRTTSVNADGGAGRLILYGGRVVIDNSRFVNNFSGTDNGRGGALYVRMDGGSLVVKDSLFHNNEAGSAGGGIYVESVGAGPAAVKIVNSRFEDNTPTAYQFVQIGTGNLDIQIVEPRLYLPLLRDYTDNPPLRARINGVTLDETNRYVVDFETENFTPALPGTHVHFFFDTVAEADAGVPGSGPWVVYGGSSPFTGYTFADRPFGPDGAERLCILVANPDHSVQTGTGNCMKLP